MLEKKLFSYNVVAIHSDNRSVKKNVQELLNLSAKYAKLIANYVRTTMEVYEHGKAEKCSNIFNNERAE